MIAAEILAPERWRVEEGEVLERLRAMPDGSLDAVLCDPPYGLGEEPSVEEIVAYLRGEALETGDFMGHDWQIPSVAVWREVLRVLRPGAPVLAFAGTRTQDLVTLGLRAAGFEIRDCLAWMYGSGFPKSHDVSKAIDKQRDDDARPVCRFLRAAMEARGVSSREIAASFGFNARMVDHWAARHTDSQPAVPTWEQWQQLKSLLGLSDEMDAEVWRLNGRKGQPGDAWQGAEILGPHKGNLPGLDGQRFKVRDNLVRAPSEIASRWEGYGTALKPAWEPVILARKPLDGTVANTALKHGTGGINIDGARIGWRGPEDAAAAAAAAAAGYAQSRANGTARQSQSIGKESRDGTNTYDPNAIAGRWPPNVALTHHEDCRRVGTRRVPASAPGGKPCGAVPRARGVFGDGDESSFRGNGSRVAYAAPDGTETVDRYECVDDCPVRMLDEQSGERPSTLTGHADPTRPHEHPADPSLSRGSMRGHRSTPTPEVLRASCTAPRRRRLRGRSDASTCRRSIQP